MKSPSERFLSPLSIPEHTCGSYRIRHIVRPAGHVFRTANLRCQLFGQLAETFSFKVSTTWHELSCEGNVWMTDYPDEHVQMLALCKQMHGRVLVGGLGLGLAIAILANSTDVDEIVVVEIAPEVRSLVWPYVDHLGKATVEIADLFTFLEETDDYFDTALFDTWQNDGEETFWSTVMPLRRLCKSVTDLVVCWNEDVMRGQLFIGLTLKCRSLMHSQLAPGMTTEKVWETLTTPQGLEYTDWMIPFFEEAQEEGFENLSERAAAFIAEVTA